jgi:hypothetical protein
MISARAVVSRRKLKKRSTGARENSAAGTPIACMPAWLAM